MHLRRALAAAGVALVLAACSSEAPGPEDGTPDRTSATATAPTGREAGENASRDPAPGSELVVVAHATRPRLRLTAAQAERLTSGRVDRWRGLDVVTGRSPARAIDAVERDAGVIAAVPVRAVGPTVVAAVVDGRDPLRGHPDAVSVTVGGDLMLVRGVPDAAAALAGVEPLLRRADLAVANLESTLSTDGRPTQDPVTDSFGGSPALVDVLAGAGLDAVSLANNHTGDYGTTALLETVAALRGGPVVPFGAGADLRAASRPAFLEAGGVRFAFLGFNAIGETPAAGDDEPGALSVRMPPRTGPLVAADVDRVAALVRQAGRRADAVVVLPHWGEQYTHTPWPVQRLVARRLVAAGADLVVGGHPHWVQGMDAVAGVPVVHSLGNLVFDMDFMPQTLEGLLLETTWWGGRLKAVRPVPYAMDASTFTPRVVGGERADAVLADLWSTSTGPYRRPGSSRRAGSAAVGGQDEPGQRSQARTVRAARSSWAGSTTEGTSPSEW